MLCVGQLFYLWLLASNVKDVNFCSWIEFHLFLWCLLICMNFQLYVPFERVPVLFWQHTFLAP